TEGFKDVLHIMRQDRPKLYDFFARRPEALVERHLRFEVPERVLHTGKIHKKLDENKLKTIIKAIKKNKIEAVAVCLIHSYVNPVHEKKIKTLLQKECPGIYISISSEILPEIKEYERMSTTTINASVHPIIESYLLELSMRLNAIGATKTIHIMQSNAGIMPSSLAGQKSVNTVLSGPAAGVLGGVSLAGQAGFQNVITVDMGGTSFDICLAHEGKPKITNGTTIGGHALKTPMIDIHAIGAGGGSIAWIDDGGVLKVGPQSAGAAPGPACYKKGGLEPTVTDANLVLGRLNPDYFLGGEMEVDTQAAFGVIEKKLAGLLGMDIYEIAEGIIKVVNASMVRGIRYVSVEKGYDPREFSLVCFGGNGPVHAAELAEELSIPEIIIPFAPGVNCAYGLLIADFRLDYVRTYLTQLDRCQLDVLNTIYKEMEREAMKKMLDEDIAEENVLFHRSIDMRYVGQGFEMAVSAPNGQIINKHVSEIKAEFDELHKRNYGFSRPEEYSEIVNLRLICTGLVPKAELKKEKLVGDDPKEAYAGEREVLFKGEFRKTDIYYRALLKPGNSIKGPAIIEQKDSTTVIPPASIARIDAYRNIIIKINVTSN
ncbi:MAG: hydantoinase/oxoprolinase family protein, partial [Phycisphaerae bacterium]|nr:hydantoinase/oxoprolinase family protein [Phycisphaerae bacterium]